MTAKSIARAANSDLNKRRKAAGGELPSERAMRLATEDERRFTFPSTSGACVDRLYALEQQRAEAERKTKLIKQEYEALEAHVLATLPKAELDGALGRTAMAKITRIDVPNATDWEKLRVYVVKNKAWDLIQKRLSAPAFRERWADKKAVPGVEIFTKVGLSVTKRT